MPEGRSTDTSVVDQVQRVSPSVNHPQVPTLMLETARWPLSRPQELDLCDTWCTQPLLSPSGYTIVLVTRNTLRLDHGYGEKPELSLVSPGFLFLHRMEVGAHVLPGYPDGASLVLSALLRFLFAAVDT